MLERPPLSSFIAEHYPEAVVKRARTAKPCNARVGRFCHIEIMPGDLYVQPGTRNFGDLEVWCWHCGELDEKQALAGRRTQEGIILSKKARRYLGRLIKDDINCSVPFDVAAELGALGIRVQTEHVRHGSTCATWSYIMQGMEKAKVLLGAKG